MGQDIIINQIADTTSNSFVWIIFLLKPLWSTSDNNVLKSLKKDLNIVLNLWSCLFLFIWKQLHHLLSVVLLGKTPCSSSVVGLHYDPPHTSNPWTINTIYVGSSDEGSILMKSFSWTHIIATISYRQSSASWKSNPSNVLIVKSNTVENVKMLFQKYIKDNSVSDTTSKHLWNVVFL